MSASAKVIPLRRGLSAKVEREYQGAEVTAKFKQSVKTSRKCTMCGRKVRRSWITKILHSRCRVCRYFIMMYGPSITVTLLPEEK